MSDDSNESIGLCLSIDQSELSLTGETGEAKTGKSVSIESLSLTKISLPNKESFISENIPTLLTIPKDDQIRPYGIFEKPANFLSMSQHISSTSGVTPSGTTLEGTLDDIPDFQDIAPLTSVVMVKKEPADNTALMSPETSPLQNTVHTLSPPSVAPVTTSTPDVVNFSESKFMQEVKHHSFTKPSSSIKSFASTTHAKTSTSGITVVEMKEPLKPKDLSNVLTVHKPVNSHSAGSIKSDTMRDISDCASSQPKSMEPSELTIFKKFPSISRSKKPFLLHIPQEDEEQDNEPKPVSRKVLGEAKALGSNRKSSSKTWKAMQDQSQVASIDSSIQKSHSENIRTSSEHVKHKTIQKKNKSSLSYIDHHEIKNIVKEEMNAVVTMQNEIWHKILDSFLDRGRINASFPEVRENKVSHGGPKEKPLLKLPVDEEECYQPLKIPIIKPNSAHSKGERVFLQFPTELDREEFDQKKEKSNNASKTSVMDEKDKQPTPQETENDKRFDVSIQTLEQPQGKQSVEVGIQHDEVAKEFIPPSSDGQNKVVSENIKKQGIMKPPAESLEYHRAIARQEIPMKMMQECRVLLENIQNSANEIKNITNDPPSRTPIPGEQVPRIMKDPKCNGYAKSKHEIFIEQFLSDDKPAVDLKRYIDVVDLPRKTSSNGHFNIPLIKSSQPSEVKKCSKFLHTTDVVKESKITKKSNSIVIGENMRESEIFSAKKEISRSPPPSVKESGISQSKPVYEEAPAQNASGEEKEVKSDEENIVSDSTSGLVYKSDSMSSIGKYLSQHSKCDSIISIPDKTVSFADQIESDKSESDPFPPNDGDSVISEPSAGHQSTPIPEQGEVRRSESPVSKQTSSHSHLKIKNPTQFSQYIASNLSRIKSAYSEVHQKEIDRSKQVNMLLCERSNQVKEDTQEQSKKKPRQSKSEKNHDKEVVVVKSSNVVKREILKAPPEATALPNKHGIEKKKPAKQAKVSKVEGNEVSVVSSDTSLPSNTEELMKAALADSDSTLHNVTPLPVQSRNKKKQSLGQVAKSTPAKTHTYNKADLTAWTEEKRKSRMEEYRKEREDKIKKELRPFQQPRQKPATTTGGGGGEFDRRAAMLRRLNMAEDLYKEMKNTPKTVVSGKPGPIKDRTSEWVLGLDLDELDSIPSQELTCENGASDITASISLP